MNSAGEPRMRRASVALSDRGEERSCLLTVAQVAEMLSLGRSTVYELIARGELEAFKVRGSVRIRPDSVRVLLEKSRI